MTETLQVTDRDRERAFIAERAGFQLVHRSMNGEWHNLKLVLLDGRYRKRNWWLAWNGDRLARSSDATKLHQYRRDIYDWVTEVLIEWSRTQR
jgi:hypothetical protein